MFRSFLCRSKNSLGGSAKGQVQVIRPWMWRVHGLSQGRDVVANKMDQTSKDMFEKDQAWQNKLVKVKSNQTAESTLDFYNQAWNDNYESILDTWGWESPRICTDLLQKYYHLDDNSKNCQSIDFIDIGCGNGAVGDAINQELINISVNSASNDNNNNNINILKKIRLYGCDVSDACLNNIKNKQLADDYNSIYVDLKLYDFNKDSKIPFCNDNNDNNNNRLFDGIIASGCFSYCNDLKKAFLHCYQALKPNGIMVFTHRNDLLLKNGDLKIIEDIINKDKLFELIYQSEPKLYLPNNPNYGNDILVNYFVIKKV